MRGASEESSTSSGVFERLFYIVGALLFGIVFVDRWFSLELDRKAPELLVTFALLYLLCWTLIVPMVLLDKGLASTNAWLQHVSSLVAVSVVLFVIERDYRAWALSKQLAEILEAGVPAELDIAPTWDESYTGDEESFMCAQGETRELSWLSAWTGQIHTLCVDIGSGRRWDAGVFYVHGRWMRIQQFLHLWTVVIVIVAAVKAFRRVTAKGKGDIAPMGSHAQPGGTDTPGDTCDMG